MAHAALGWSESEQARRFAAFYRESTPWEVARTAYKVLREIDVRALLSKVRVPTLVIQRRQVPWAEVNLARELASAIPGARLALLEGTSLAAYLGDTEEAATAIDEFLGDSRERVPSIEAPAPGGPINVILFTDMEDSTALTQRLGDAKAQELVRTHNGIVRDALRTHDGTEIKHTGDGIMASFMSASRAVACALAIQRAVASYTEHHTDTPLRLRIGLNAGEPVAEEGDLFGTAVQLAARIRDLSEPNQVVVSNVVRELAAGKGFMFSDLAEVTLRGFEDPVRLYEVRWREG